MPEHCDMDVWGYSSAIRQACDQFFERRGMNVYGGFKEIIRKSVEKTQKKKKKKSPGSA